MRHQTRRSRKWAVLRILLGLFLLLLTIFVIALQDQGLPGVIAAIFGILLVTFGLLFYFQGCIALARAKGYDDSMVLGALIFGAFCTLGFAFILPLIIAFCLKDKTKTQPHWARARQR